MDRDPIKLFLSEIKRLELVPESVWQSHSDTIASDGVRSRDELAKALVAQQVLTQYQADCILSGKGDDCVLAGRYHLLEKIGAGGMGNVFRARDTMLDRIVAIKLMAARSLMDKDAVTRFKREARALASLTLPNIVQAFDTGEDRGRHFLVMEHVDGIGLNDLIRKEGRIPPTIAADYAFQVAVALERAHARGMIHRDIKPGNVILANNGYVKVLDLGLAKFLQDNLPDSHVTRDNTGLGTPDYMPPEQFHDARTVDTRADIYALGCTLYHLIAGQVPFPGSSFSEKVRAHETKQPISLEQHCPEIPAGLMMAVEKMMAKQPSDRYQSMRDVASALAPYVSGSSPSLPLAKRTVTFQSDETQHRIRRARWLAWTGGAACMMAVVALAIVGLARLWSPPERLPGADGRAKSQTSRVDQKADGKRIATQADGGAVSKVTIPDGLTVALDGRGDYTSIGDALDNVQQGQTIRILDAGPYRERMSIDRRHTGVTIESPLHAAISVNTATASILIDSVSDVTIRGLRLRVEDMPTSPAGDFAVCVSISGDCTGLVLEDLETDARVAGSYGAILITAYSTSSDRPILIRNCHMRRAYSAINFGGGLRFSTANVIVSGNNIEAATNHAVMIQGKVINACVAGNRVVGCMSGIVMGGLSGECENIFIANNTFFQNVLAFAIDGDLPAGKAVHVQNNLFLDSGRQDIFHVDGLYGGGGRRVQPRDGKLTHQVCDMGHNWREVPKTAQDSLFGQGWVPPNEEQLDKRLETIELLSRDEKSADFLRPAKDSPLAGAAHPGVAYPRFVGAIAPPGAEHWNWRWTWDAIVNHSLTVSKTPEHEARYDSISAALEEVQTGMTVRVIDDGPYSESVRIIDANRHRGITIQGLGTTVVEGPAGPAIEIASVEDVTVRALTVRTQLAGKRDLVIAVHQDCAGLRLQDLTVTSTGQYQNAGIAFLGGFKAAGATNPTVVKDCHFEDLSAGVIFQGFDASGRAALPVERVVLAENYFATCQYGIIAKGACRNILIVGNRIISPGDVGIQMEHLMAPTRNVLVANNTIGTINGQGILFRVWEDNRRVKSGEQREENICIYNNLLLGARGSDMLFLDSGDDQAAFQGPGDVATLLDVWHFGHNWREASPPTGDDIASKSWIHPNESEGDMLRDKIELLSRKIGDPDFLRPPPDSPLANSGLEKEGLPPYIGAVPPQGVQPWDWMRTWSSFSQADEDSSPPEPN